MAHVCQNIGEVKFIHFITQGVIFSEVSNNLLDEEFTNDTKKGDGVISEQGFHKIGKPFYSGSD